ncbi:MAG: hypothetical protein M3443_11475 [Actinomycetota bacterium]|nr:hypothetical protein [Actinomycetota bacterium]
MTLAHDAGPTSGRIAASREIQSIHIAEQCSKAARTVADHASGVDDCKLLLEMLGLDSESMKRPDGTDPHFD